MVELVDTLVSGTSARKGMEVRVFFRASLYEKTSHQEHEGREDHKKESGVFVRWLRISFTIR
jgi:hypothetical protein